MYRIKREEKKVKLWKNKLAAIVLVLTGMVSVDIEGDGTVLIWTLMIAVPLFLEKENCFIE